MAQRTPPADTGATQGWRRRQALTVLGALWLAPLRAEQARDYVVIVHPQATPPSRQTIAGIYLGGASVLQPLDLSLPAALRSELYQALTGYPIEHVQAQWARLVFTGRGQPPRMMKRPEDLRHAVAGNPRLIGYLPRQHLDDSVRVALALD